MPLKKLTLNAPAEVIESAKQLADEKGISLSAMVVRLLRALEEIHGPDESSLGPLTRSVSGIVDLPSNKSDTELLQDALSSRD